MQLSPDNHTATYQIRAYEPGRIQINQQWLERSIIVAAEHLDANWAPQSLAELTAEHLTAILALSPTIVLIGTGLQLRFPPQELLFPFYQAKIGVEIMDTAAACRTHALLSSEGRNVVSGLLIC